MTNRFMWALSTSFKRIQTAFLQQRKAHTNAISTLLKLGFQNSIPPPWHFRQNRPFSIKYRTNQVKFQLPLRPTVCVSCGGGTRQHWFGGANLKPRKTLENAARTPVPQVGCTSGEQERPISPKKQMRNGSILRIGRHLSSPSGKAVETHNSLQSRGAPWFPITMIHPLVAWR